MNVLGNALKYTQKGMIIVKLALDELAIDAGAEEKNERMLEVKITDTGKGISSEYLRTSLYTRMSSLYLL
jgi:signal transduction histidine kinase